MKKTFFVLLVAVMFILPASASYAGDKTLHLVGRELSAGIQIGDVYYAALFLGKIYDARYSRDLGDFSVTLNRVDEGVEQCGQDTRILQFKLKMYFNDGSRLVLVLDEPDAVASWDYDDPFCPDGCIFPGYYAYIAALETEENPFPSCTLDTDDVALIANVGSEFDPIVLRKQWLGSSWSGLARNARWAELNGWLVHTPLIVPAVFGTVVLH